MSEKTPVTFQCGHVVGMAFDETGADLRNVVETLSHFDCPRCATSKLQLKAALHNAFSKRSKP